MRAIGYIRVSTSRQELGTSLAAQQDAISSLAEERSFQLLATVSETGSAGVRQGALFSWEHRPALLDLIDRAASSEFDALIVAKFDRLSRDHASLTILKRTLSRHGVQLISASEQSGDSSLARLLEAQLALFAEFERDTINERLQLGKARRKAQGRHVHGRVPFGYRSRGGCLEINDAEAAAVQRMFQLRSQGRRIAHIARQLNTEGHPTRQGGPWQSSTVAGILRNAAYLGERYGVRGAHPQLIHRRTWNRAQKRATR